MPTLSRFLCFTLLLTGLAVVGTSPSWAQCAKRVVVYLDVSESMDPRGRRAAASPFHQSLEAVRGLLASGGFLESEDVVELLPFGETVDTSHPPATGPEAIGRALDGLRSVAPGNDTNLGNVLADLPQRVNAGSHFARQVFIIASDFANEPRHRNHDLAGAWAQALEEAKPGIDRALKDNPQSAVLLFRAPASGTAVSGETRADLQARAVADLRSFLGERGNLVAIGAGGLDAKGLAAYIHLQLLAKPEVAVHLASGDPSSLEVRVTNPNCLAQKLAAIKLRCIGESGAVSQPVAMTIDEAHRTLGPTGGPAATQTVRGKVPQGSCWETSPRLVAEVSTSDGLVGSSEGTTGTTLSIKPLAAFREDALFLRHILRLELEARGQYAAAKIFELEVRDGGGRPIARGRFYAPSSLEPDTPRPYRMILPLPYDVAQQVQDDAPIRVSLAENKSASSPSEGEVTRIHGDDARSYTGIVSQWIAIGSAILSLALFFLGRRNQIQPLMSGVKLLEVVTISFLPFALAIFRPALFERLSLRAFDLLLLLVAAAAPATVTFMLARTIHLGRLAELTLSTRAFDYEAYKRSVRRGWTATAWAITVGGAAVVAILWIGGLGHAGHPAEAPEVIPLLNEGS